MLQTMLGLVSQLAADAHYREAEQLLRRLERDPVGPAGTAVRELLAELGTLCGACGDQHERALAQWHAAAVEAASEHRLRSELVARLSAVIGGEDSTPTVPTPVAVPAGNPRASPAASGFSVYCLGPLRVFVGDRDLGPVPNRRARSVFRYLLLHRYRHTPRDVLMALFWPDAAPGAARNNLNVAVHGLRRYLRSADDRDGHVLFQGDGYQLNPDVDLWVDLEAFNARTDRACTCRRAGDVPGEIVELEAAELLYHGALFEDDPYEDWSLDVRRGVQDSYVEALDRLGLHYHDRGDHGGQSRVLRKILVAQPANEPAHRALMQCYAGVGQHHLALRQFDDCRSALREVLDLEPSRETRQVHERIRNREPVWHLAGRAR